MKLVSLSLENIKSYVQETIEFYEGINFISGKNGSGKTTIIEAIGYALFDANPFSSLKQFVREGQKTGVISLVIEAKDERLYRIVRKIRIPSGNSWTVYDLGTDTELNHLYGTQDVKQWLTENLRLNKGLDLSLLFEDIIGVSQGKFTAPFLERGERRKKIFNTILQLESYRETYEKTAGLTTTLSQNMSEIESEIKSWSVRVEDLAECRLQLEEHQRKLQILREKLASIDAQYIELDQEFNKQEELKRTLESLEKNLQIKSIRLTSLNEQRKRIEKDIKEALICQEKVVQAAPGYKAYLSLQEVQKELEEKLKLKLTLEKNSQVLENKVSSLQAEINSYCENQKKQIEEAESELRELKTQGELTASLLKDCLLEQKEGEKIYQSWKENQAFWQSVKEKIYQLSQVQSIQEGYHKLKNKLTAEKSVLENNLTQWEQLEKLALEIPLLEQELHQILKEYSRLEEKETSLEANLITAQDGLCPFLQKKCLTVEGSLAQYFVEELKKIAPEKEKLTAKQQELEQRLENAIKAQKELYRLQHQKELLGNISSELNQLMKDFKENEKKVKDVLQSEYLQALDESLNELKNIFEIFDLQEGLSLMRQNLGFLIQEAKRDGYDFLNLIELLEKLNQLGTNFFNKIETALSQQIQELNSKSSGLNEKLKSLREQYVKVNEACKKWKEDRIIIEKEANLTQNIKELQKLKDELQAFLSLEELLEKNKAAKTEYEPLYIQYMQYVEEAKKVERLNNELNKLSQEQELELKDMKQWQEEQAELQKKYQPNKMTDLRQERERLLEQKGKSEQEKESSQEQVNRYSQLVHEKEQIIEKISGLKEQLLREKKAGELLRLIRNTLNVTGEKMALVYRGYLGREADLLYQKVSKENVHLSWQDDYEVKILDHVNDQERERTFSQLSGGEKMTAALAIRLALLKHLSGLGIGFFDEPTANLDDYRRTNLAQIIPEITKHFRQIFIISHDDTFDAITENIIMLEKSTQLGTKVVKSYV